MAKILKYNDEARRAILEGVMKLSDAVQVTLGPRGRNVAIDKKFGAPTITKDCANRQLRSRFRWQAYSEIR